MDPEAMSPELVAACIQRDVTAIFRILNKSGVPQRRIAELAKMSQSEVSEILKGRKVMAYDALVRVAAGFDIPRGLMGLAYTEGLEEVDEDVKRRALLAAATTALVGSPVLGEVLELPRPVEPTPLPSRLSSSDVVSMRSLTTSLQAVAREYGGCAEMVGAVANRSRVLLSVPATDEIKAEISVALAELHTMAGWCCVDGGFGDQARAFFAIAMDLGDSYQIAWAFRHAGIQMVDVGAYDDGLKAFQLAMMSTRDPELTACLHIESAQPLAAMGYKELALDALKKGNEHPQSNVFDAADMDNVASAVHSRLGRLVTAESYVQTGLQKWVTLDAKRDSVEAEIMLATIHLKAGEPDGTALAKRALADVAPLQSVRARVKLEPLERALVSRNDSTCRDLARIVRQIRVPSRAV